MQEADIDKNLQGTGTGTLFLWLSVGADFVTVMNFRVPYRNVPTLLAGRLLASQGFYSIELVR
jgi:hypothetical protein